MPNEPWIKHNGMDPRSLTLTGIGPNIGQRGWNHGPHYGVEVYGPSGPRDPCAVQISLYVIVNLLNFFNRNLVGVKHTIEFYLNATIYW